MKSAKHKRKECVRVCVSVVSSHASRGDGL